jgi:hypothetical protein
MRGMQLQHTGTLTCCYLYGCVLLKFIRCSLLTRCFHISIYDMFISKLDTVTVAKNLLPTNQNILYKSLNAEGIIKEGPRTSC